MAQPEKISAKLGKELIRRLHENEYIRSDEELSYRREIAKVGKEDVQDIQAWAFYFALMRNETEALKYFKKSLRLGFVPFIENYLAYLLRTSRIREFMAVALGLRAKYRGEASIMDSVSWASILTGDIRASRKALEALRLLQNKDQEIYANYLSNFNSFIENTQFTDENLKSLMDAFILLVERNKLVAGGVAFESHPEFGVNSVEFSIYFPEANVEKLVDMNVELAFELGAIPSLDGKVFSSSFDFFEAKACL